MPDVPSQAAVPDALGGRRLLVVGASSGIGRALAVLAARAGAKVALAARRGALVEAAAAEAGPGALPLVCDAADEASCRAVVTAAVEGLGGLDTVVYLAGASRLAPVADTPVAEWQAMLATNLVGAAVVAAASLEALRRAPRPVLCFVSSHSVGRPWPGLVGYAASKAALEELARGLRAEEPWLRVVRVSVGPTVTGFADGWDPGRASGFFERWAAEGYLVHRVLEPTETAAGVLDAVVDPGRGDDVLVIGEETGG